MAYIGLEELVRYTSQTACSRKIVESLRLRVQPLTNPAITQAQSQDYELTHPHIHPVWSAGACKRTGPADPKLQDLNNTGQQQDIQEKSSEGPA